MNPSYIAGFIDGDGSIFISKSNEGPKLMFEITQCHMVVLKAIQLFFDGKGKIYVDQRENKYNGEAAAKLRFYCKDAIKPLMLMRDFAVIKYKQAETAFRYFDVATDKEELRLEMKQLNEDKQSYPAKLDRINDAYIGGIFDAEGNVYCNYEKGVTKKFKYYVKITQKDVPSVASAIQSYLGYGQVYKNEAFRIRFESQAVIEKFYQVVKPHMIVKTNDFDKLRSAFSCKSRKKSALRGEKKTVSTNEA